MVEFLSLHHHFINNSLPIERRPDVEFVRAKINVTNNAPE
jgi:hypothetical protein